MNERKTDKHWLIRTGNMKILGPVSRNKIVELTKKGSLGQDDEISSGDGYWFQVREQDLLDKYIFQNIKQDFNPISEAKDVVSLSCDEEVKPPDALPQIEDDITKVVSIDELREKEKKEQAQEKQKEDQKEIETEIELEIERNEIVESSLEDLPPPPIEEVTPKGPKVVFNASVSNDDPVAPADEDLEFPDIGDMVDSAPAPTLAPALAPAPIEEKQEKKKTKKLPKKVLSDAPKKAHPEQLEVSRKKSLTEEVMSPTDHDFVVDKKSFPKKSISKIILKIIVSLLIILTIAFGAIYFYYVKIINKPIPFLGSQLSLVSTAYAQDIILKEKKKNF